MPPSNELIDTWDVLEVLGFEPDDSVISEGATGLSRDLGRIRLSAGRMMNLSFRQVIQFNAVYQIPRTIGTVDFEMPTQVESVEQCSAWIAWQLNEQLPRNEKLVSPTKASFVLLGLQHLDTLPWVRERAAYLARPKCFVERSWMRVALNALEANVRNESDDTEVGVTFDGRVLVFSTPGWLVPVPATGEPWTSSYGIRKKLFSKFPPRLMTPQVEVSVLKDRLRIGNWQYTGLTTTDAKRSDTDHAHVSGESQNG